MFTKMHEERQRKVAFIKAEFATAKRQAGIYQHALHPLIEEIETVGHFGAMQHVQEVRLPNSHCRLVATKNIRGSGGATGYRLMVEGRGRMHLLTSAVVRPGETWDPDNVIGMFGPMQLDSVSMESEVVAAGSDEEEVEFGSTDDGFSL